MCAEWTTRAQVVLDVKQEAASWFKPGRNTKQRRGSHFTTGGHGGEGLLPGGVVDAGEQGRGQQVQSDAQSRAGDALTPPRSQGASTPPRADHHGGGTAPGRMRRLVGRSMTGSQTHEALHPSEPRGSAPLPRVDHALSFSPSPPATVRGPGTMRDTSRMEGGGRKVARPPSSARRV